MSGSDPQLHPVAEVIIAVLKDGPDDIPVLDSEGLGHIEQVVDAFLPHGDELMEAVDCVLTIAHLLEVEKGAVDAARALVEIVDRQVVIDALVAVNDAKDVERAEAVESTASRFQEFSDAPKTPCPPAPDDDAKDDALKLDNFSFRRRL